jgi:hypothetical protein
VNLAFHYGGTLSSIEVIMSFKSVLSVLVVVILPLCILIACDDTGRGGHSYPLKGSAASCTDTNLVETFKKYAVATKFALNSDAKPVVKDADGKFEFSQAIEVNTTRPVGAHKADIAVEITHDKDIKDVELSEAKSATPQDLVLGQMHLRYTRSIMVNLKRNKAILLVRVSGLTSQENKEALDKELANGGTTTSAQQQCEVPLHQEAWSYDLIRDEQNPEQIKSTILFGQPRIEGVTNDTELSDEDALIKELKEPLYSHVPDLQSADDTEKIRAEQANQKRIEDQKKEDQAKQDQAKLDQDKEKAAEEARNKKDDGTQEEAAPEMDSSKTKDGTGTQPPDTPSSTQPQTQTN